MRDLNLVSGQRQVNSIDQLISEVRGGNPDAFRLVKEAGLAIGSAVANLVNLLNPKLVVIGGQLAALDEIILASIRQSVYEQSLLLATRNLEIVPSALDNPGVVGLAELVVTRILRQTARG